MGGEMLSQGLWGLSLKKRGPTVALYWPYYSIRIPTSKSLYSVTAPMFSVLRSLISVLFSASLIVCRSTVPSKSICDNGYSVHSEVLHCWTDNVLTPAQCNIDSCSRYSIGHNCKNLGTKVWSTQVTCKKEYRPAQDGVSLPTCVDENDDMWECNDGCQGVLTCAECFSDETLFTKQLRKRGNGFAAGMMGGPGVSTGGFESTLNL
ncbi:hypothetical protein O181_020551 [Austropuccinia psidii MF-1]|uniref:Uncharacterized protein n=1 Tax=Austropuccinia psidii MF-1 TaxID=1389203 RepID=A0A9Q3GUX7_9BASI|nr:hypothetical protein [Austropuccinia psidii MF-1]